MNIFNGNSIIEANTKVLNSDILTIETREDLAVFFNVRVKYVNFVLYGRHRDSHYKKFEINKSSGNPRTLHAVTGRLKILQRIALDQFQAESIYTPSGYAHGFTKDKSIITNALLHRRKKLIVKVDLKDFFPSINFGRVLGMFMAPPFHFGKEAAITMAQLSCLDDESGELPQGGVLSPYISNMLCRRLDKRLARLAKNNRCHFTRYADDMTFSTNDILHLNTNKFLEEIYAIIESEHFEINEEKTKVLTCKDRQIVTGIVVNDGMNVTRKYIRNIRATIRNCEKFGVKSQIVKKDGFKDNRNSRIQQNNETVPTEIYFLRYLFGKINFFGNVVLSAKQNECHADDENKYQRIRTYEELLWRFYKLKEVEQSRGNIRREIHKITTRAIEKRPRLACRLRFKDQAFSVKREPLNEYRSNGVTKKCINELSTTSDVRSFVDRLGKKDPRFFNFNGNDKIAVKRIAKLLSYPPIDKNKVLHVLKSLKADGNNELKHIVHSGRNFTLEDCYRVLLESYEVYFYFLPKGLKDDFEDWKKALDGLSQKKGDHYKVDVVTDQSISKQTNQLKKHTRFTRRNGNDGTVLWNELDAITKRCSKLKPDVLIEVEGKSPNLYTHTPSILRAVDLICESMVKHVNSSSPVITINIAETEGKQELTIRDNSEEAALDTFVNRKFIHGKLAEVINLTNGLCDYLIELLQEDGKRASLNMHTEEPCSIKHKNGFVHQLIFENI